MNKSKLRKEYEARMGTVDGTLRLFNTEGNEVYCEESGGFWILRKFNGAGKLVYYENSLGSWAKYEFNDEGKLVYFEHSTGYWQKCEYNDEGKEVYYEDSDGTVRDNRPNKARIFTDENGTKYKVEVIK